MYTNDNSPAQDKVDHRKTDHEYNDDTQPNAASNVTPIGAPFADSLTALLPVTRIHHHPEAEPDAAFRAIESILIETPALANSVATVLSDLLFYHCALGAGYRSPLPETRGLVFSSAISPAANSAMISAERQFLQEWEKEIAPMREELEGLEAKAKDQKKRGESPMDSVTGLSRDALAAKISVLREKVRQIGNVMWRDHFAHKINLIDLLQRSAHGALSYFDDGGSRLLAAFCHPTRLAADFSLVTLTGSSADSAMIRATGTGGINVMNLVRDEPVNFNYLCSLHPKVIPELSKKISETNTGTIILGRAIVIGGTPNKKGVLGEAQLARLLGRAMNQVYSLGRKPDTEKVRVEFENDEVREAWNKFLELKLRDYINREVRAEDIKKEDEMPASLSSIALFASRAATTAAILSAVDRSSSAPQSVALTMEHLRIAQLFAFVLFRQHYDSRWLIAKQKNAAKARATFLTPGKLEAAYEKLLGTLLEKETISRSDAMRLDAVTGGLLDRLVEEGAFVELSGIHAGKRTRIYTLPKNARIDADEAIAELSEACELFEQSPNYGHPNLWKDYDAIQKKAKKNKNEHFAPCVPLTHMTIEEIQAVPFLLKKFEDRLLLRGGKEDPEPEELFDPEDEDCLFERGVPNLWFRRGPDGKPFADWKKSIKLNMPESWQEDEEEMEET